MQHTAFLSQLDLCVRLKFLFLSNNNNNQVREVIIIISQRSHSYVCNKITLLSLFLQGERCIRSASPTKAECAMCPVLLPPCPQSAPVHSKTASVSPKTIFPYPSPQTASPKSPRRLSLSGIFRSSSSCSSTSIKLFSRTRRGELQHPASPPPQKQQQK